MAQGRETLQNFWTEFCPHFNGVGEGVDCSVSPEGLSSYMKNVMTTMDGTGVTELNSDIFEAGYLEVIGLCGEGKFLRPSCKGIVFKELLKKLNKAGQVVTELAVPASFHKVDLNNDGKLDFQDIEDHCAKVQDIN